MAAALRAHWPLYLIEAAGLGTFMFVAGSVAVGLGHLPPAAARYVSLHPTVQRALFGALMGLTAITIIYSPWGQRSGAHINPAVTVTYLRLGKSEPWDALCYIAAQFLGGAVGFFLIAQLLRPGLAEPSVHYIVTQPGTGGVAVAFVAESCIAGILMFAILFASNHRRLGRWTGLLAGLLVATYITVEAPLSGMSMNPARTFASAFAAHDWTAIWVYFVAPPLGMLAAAEAFVRWKGRTSVICAKLCHRPDDVDCIFRCGYRRAAALQQEHHSYA
jgi:aquaporin Z